MLCIVLVDRFNRMGSNVPTNRTLVLIMGSAEAIRALDCVSRRHRLRPSAYCLWGAYDIEVIPASFAEPRTARLRLEKSADWEWRDT